MTCFPLPQASPIRIQLKPLIPLLPEAQKYYRVYDLGGE